MSLRTGDRKRQNKYCLTYRKKLVYEVHTMGQWTVMTHVYSFLYIQRRIQAYYKRTGACKRWHWLEAPVTRGVKSHPLMTMILSTLSH